MRRDYTTWHKQKSLLESSLKNRVFFHIREIWWCRLGANIGFEEDGKGDMFSRPVLIFKKFNNEVFWAIPLSTKIKDGKFYTFIQSANLKPQVAILSQLRLIDSKRLLNKMGTITKDDYQEIQKAVMNLVST